MSETVNPVTFALNRTCAPQLMLADFIALAQKVGVGAVEIRNDIEGREFADGMPAAELRARLGDAGLKLASINALQRFNDWTPSRDDEACALFDYAAALGAAGVVLCPAHLPGDGLHDDAHRRLCDGLAALKSICADTGVIGHVESLGMRHSSMNRICAAPSDDQSGNGRVHLGADDRRHGGALIH